MQSDVVDPISSFLYVQIDGAEPAKSELVFIANQIPPLGIQTYLVNKVSSEVNKSGGSDKFKFGDEVSKVSQFYVSSQKIMSVGKIS